MTGNSSDDEDVSLSQNMSRHKKAVNGYDGVLMAYEICPPEEFDKVEKAESAMQVDNLMWQKKYGVEFASNVIESKTKGKFTYVIPYYGGTNKDWKYSVSIKNIPGTLSFGHVHPDNNRGLYGFTSDNDWRSFKLASHFNDGQQRFIVSTPNHSSLTFMTYMGANKYSFIQAEW
jgi:hypothetical protein